MCLTFEKKRLYRRVSLIIVLAGFALLLSAQFAGGSGTEDDPWLIENAQHLDNTRNYLGSDHQDKHYLQIADIDLGVPPYNTGSGWIPVGTSLAGHSFWGHYDGGDYRIYNLTINRNSSSQGLFGILIAATIVNVNLVDVDIFGSNDVGGLAGYILRNSTITNCYVSGEIYATSNVGGLIGKVVRTVNVSRCGSSARVTGRDYVGGIVGFFDATNTITECYFDGYVLGYNDYIGGIIGSTASRINRCYSNGEVKGNSRVGGIAGNSGQSILYCYSNSTVKGNSRVGGIVGSIFGANIIESYVSGLVNGNTHTGGISGSGFSNYATESFWIPETTGQTHSSIGSPLSREMIIRRESLRNWSLNTIWTIIDGRTLPYLRWQEEPAAHNIPAPLMVSAEEAAGNIILQWKSPVAGEISGYNIYRDGMLLNSEGLFEDTLFVDTDTGIAREYMYYVTAMTGDFGESGKSNPLFIATAAGFEGDGTVESPYIITDHHQFNAIRRNLEAHYRLVNNIDLSSFSENEGWVPVGNRSTPFTGSLDGGGFTAANLTINQRTQSYLGLFGRTVRAVISNLGVIDVTVTGNIFVGGLVGESYYSSIHNSYVTGKINADQVTGLLAGRVFSGLIENCFTEGRATARSPAGLVGTLQDSTIRNSYSNASLKMTVDGFTGGIASFATGSIIENSYSTGAIVFPGAFGLAGGLVGTYSELVTVTNSYWNIETTGVSYSAGGGVGLTTLEMTDRMSFENWDFGINWDIGYNERATYPWLRIHDEPREASYPSLIPPGRLTASAVREDETELIWLPPSVGNPEAYRIYKDGNLLANVGGDVTRYADRDIEVMTTNSYYVTAVYGEEESSRSLIANATPVPGGYAGGRGSIDEPYEIDSAIRLDNVRYNLESHFIQTDDIDLLHFGSWQPIGDDGEQNNRSEPFTGSFDGNGYSIENLYINEYHGNYSGLFGYVGRRGSGAVLKNITLDNVNISGYKTAGGLAGKVDFNTSVENCHVSGTVLNESNYTSPQTGGLVGEMSYSEISNSSGRGFVKGSRNVGGLVGEMDNSHIRNSYASSAVALYDIFGIYIGGFVGSMRNNSSISDSYSGGPVKGSRRLIGGFAGSASHSSIVNSYSTSRVEAMADAEDVGGFAGYTFRFQLQNCYWDITLSGIDHSDLGEGRESEQMRFPFDEDTYVNWDFEDVWNYDAEGELNFGYPYHRWVNEEMINDYPLAAVTPKPEHESASVSINTDSISWVYVPDVMYQNPLGFRVYIGNNTHFGDDFIWVPMSDSQVYSLENILPEDVDYAETFYWKVVPTTTDSEFRGAIPGSQGGSGNSRRLLQRDSSRLRNDARNVPTWSFTIEKHPVPVNALHPVPAVGASNVPLDLQVLRWSFYSHPYHSDPQYFRVYLKETDTFEEDDDFEWVHYRSCSTNFTAWEILRTDLKPHTSYYWKVIPTTFTPDTRMQGEEGSRYTEGWEQGRPRRRDKEFDRLLFPYRNDAENVVVWSFRTELGTSADNETAAIVTGLQSNYPNPFNPRTTISYAIGERTGVKISVYNIRGQFVKSLVNEVQYPGAYRVVWEGRDDAGREMSSGVYYYRLMTDDHTESRKMIMIR